MKAVTFLALVAWAVLIITVIGTSWSDMTGPAYEFNREVHGHMENAYYANEPTLMKSELQKAIDGMRDLDLEPQMFGAFWGWDRVPNLRMSYQYDHLDGIMARINSTIVWYNANYGPNSTGNPESLGDVYEQKMDDLRAFLQEDGWSDWIAHDTFYVNHHLFIYLAPLIYLAMIAVAGILSVIAWIAEDMW